MWPRMGKPSSFYFNVFLKTRYNWHFMVNRISSRCNCVITTRFSPNTSRFVCVFFNKTTCLPREVWKTHARNQAFPTQRFMHNTTMEIIFYPSNHTSIIVKRKYYRQSPCIQTFIVQRFEMRRTESLQTNQSGMWFVWRLSVVEQIEPFEARLNSFWYAVWWVPPSHVTYIELDLNRQYLATILSKMLRRRHAPRAGAISREYVSPRR